jgi:hypothetical protein
VLPPLLLPLPLPAERPKPRGASSAPAGGGGGSGSGERCPSLAAATSGRMARRHAALSAIPAGRLRSAMAEQRFTGEGRTIERLASVSRQPN